MKPTKSAVITDLQVGDVAQVRPGVIDTDTKVDMSGWCGRVTEVYPDHGTASITFDSQTLKEMPPSYIKQCRREGYDGKSYTYELAELTKITARDTSADVSQQVESIKAQQIHDYAYLGEEGEEIEQIFTSVDPEGKMDGLSIWWEYLEAKLKFPIEAIVDEGSERGPLRVGDKIRIHGLEMADKHYGIIVRVRRGREQFHRPLYDIAAADPTSPAYDLIDLYRTWFANPQ